MKTLVIISDLHCGSIFGITPPTYWEKEKVRRSIQKETWQAYSKIASDWHNPNYLLANGDLIDGTQKKQGGAELTTPDRNIQCEMAFNAVTKFAAKNYLLTYGSPYHVSENAEDFEYKLGKDLDATVGGRLFFEIDGVRFDARHHIGGSGIPHGRATPILREIMWNLIGEAIEGAPHIHCVIRSHVHYYLYVEVEPSRCAIITPGLQVGRGRHGSRRCTGKISWGAIRLKIDNGKIVDRETRICQLETNRPKLIKLK